MKAFHGSIPKKALNLFSSDIGSGEFFSYVGNLVSLEQAIAVLGILSPDFIEQDDCVFWTPSIQGYDPQSFALKGLVESEAGGLRKSSSRRDVERYRNNFPISLFFSKWESVSNKSVLKVGLSEEECRLCHIFAGQIKKYWSAALSECFPERTFQFEISDNLLDEYGVCLTFWQP